MLVSDYMMMILDIVLVKISAWILFMLYSSIKGTSIGTRYFLFFACTYKLYLH